MRPLLSFKIRLMILISALACILPHQTLAKTYALLVGCSDYPGTSSDLDYVPTNIQNVREVLRDIYDVPSGNIVSYVDTVTDGDAFEAAITTLLSHHDATMFVIYWSGHGKRIGSSSYYDMPDGLFFDSDLNALLATVDVQTVVIAQHCHAGGFAANCGSTRTVAMTASSIDRLAWGGPSGSDFTCNITDGFSFHQGHHSDWVGHFLNWLTFGWWQPDTADDNQDGDVSFAEGFDYADDNIGGFWSSLFNHDSDPQIGGDDRGLYFDEKYDFTAPYVTSRNYSSARSTSIYVTFNERLDETTLSSANISVSGSSSDGHSCTYTFHREQCQLTINPATDFSYTETVTVTLGTGIKDLSGNGLSSTYQFSFAIQNEPVGPRTSINITSLSLSPSTVDPYGSFEVSGNASYNNGELVHDGTARIVVQSGSTYTIAVNGGHFERDCQAPGNNGTSQISKNVTVTVSDGVVTEDQESRTLYVRGQGGTSYDLDTSIVYDWDGDDSSVTYWSKDAFRTTDEKVDLIGVFDNMSGSGWLDLKWQCYRPTGAQYGSELVENDAINLEWGWGWWAWGWLINGQSMAYNPGKYRMDFFVNNDRKATHYFVVAWDFTQHFLCKDFDGNWQPINEANIFSPSDTRAVALHHFEYRAQGLDVKTEFYAPDGSLYSTEPYSFADDLGPHEWQGWSRNAAWIWINGYSAAYMCGDWTVKFYVKNPSSSAWEQKYTDYFRIEEQTAPSISVVADPSSPTETQSLALKPTASDNNHLKKVTLHWHDGSWHEQSWDNLNAASWNGSKTVLAAATAGQQVEYWAEAWDESGNRSETTHQTVLVNAETVSAPNKPTGPTSGMPAELMAFSTAGSTTSLGTPVEYQFEWGNGQTSAWVSASADWSWPSEGLYLVRARARSQQRPSRLSDWSAPLPVDIQGLEIVTVGLPSGMEMVPFNEQLEATNGTPPYTWSVAEGYSEQSAANSFSYNGVAQGWQADDNTWNLVLPFPFPFFGHEYNQCWVDSNGKIRFDGGGSDYSESVAELINAAMIAVLWDDLRTDSGYDIFVDSQPDSITIRWYARYYSGGAPVNVSATLHADGTISLRYGTGNANGGLIGVSAGDGANYLISAQSQSGSMDSAADILFQPAGRLPDGLALSTNGVLAGIPLLATTSAVTFVVQDAVADTDMRTIDLVIDANPNTRPVISSNAPPAGAFSMGEATNQLFQVWAYDPEGSNLTYYWTCDGVQVGSDSSSYTHTTDLGDSGQYALRCHVSDDLWENIVYSEWIVSVLYDSDGDGMPDWWEGLHSASSTALEAFADNDFDGATNFDEWIANTDPNNYKDVFRAWFDQQAWSVDGRRSIKWTSRADRLYHVYRSEETDPLKTWKPLTLNISATPPVGSYEDSGILGMDLTIYRVSASLDPKAGAPIISPPGGVFDHAVEVNLLSNLEDCGIHFTLDGSVPDDSSSLYAGGVSVESDSTLKAIVIKEGYLPSDIAVAYFTIDIANVCYEQPSDYYNYGSIEEGTYDCRNVIPVINCGNVPISVEVARGGYFEPGETSFIVPAGEMVYIRLCLEAPYGSAGFTYEEQVWFAIEMQWFDVRVSATGTPGVVIGPFSSTLGVESVK